MAWRGIDGHDDVVERFRRALGRRRLASSFLFVGPEGIGKRSFALELARTLLCRARPEEAMDPCGECPACLQVAAGTHPDLELVAKPKDKSFLPLELLIGDKDHRMRQGLCHALSLRPFMGGRKIGIVDDADYLAAEGANSLLKTLEEPPPRSVLILIGTSPAKQLPTIRSRCQLIRFRPLASEIVAELLIRHGVVEHDAEARRLAAHSEGSLSRATELADPELWAFRARLYDQLAEPTLESRRLAPAVVAFVEEAGREAPARRRRARQVIGLAAEFYRGLIRALCDASDTADAELQRSVHAAVETGTADALDAAACLDRCLEAADQIDRNAYLPTLLECWLDDLGKTAAPGRTTAR